MSLKSNMDRFIAYTNCESDRAILILKSNMDRFIVSTFYASCKSLSVLKSNMDRFIEKRVEEMLNRYKL